MKMKTKEEKRRKMNVVPRIVLGSTGNRLPSHVIRVDCITADGFYIQYTVIKWQRFIIHGNKPNRAISLCM